MIIEHIGTRALSLYISGNDLQQWGLRPEQIGREEATRLLVSALDARQLSDWEIAELEVYPGRDSALLFARRRADAPCLFFFADFESLVRAAHLCPDALPSALCRIPEGYLLTIYPFEGDAPPVILHEFGIKLDYTPYLTPHLTEQNCTLIPFAALAHLKEAFYPLPTSV